MELELLFLCRVGFFALHSCYIAYSCENTSESQRRRKIMGFTGSSLATEKRRESLKHYLDTDVLNNRFVCKTRKDCKQSLKGKESFYVGHLPHIGRYYDLEENDNPLRIVVVGQEYGGKKQKISLDAEYEGIMKCALHTRFRATDGYPARNPHMRGTTSVLRLLFGKQLGTDHPSEFIDFNGIGSRHIFDAFCLVDYYLCSALSGNSKTQGRATRTMGYKCQRHFKRIIEKLEPTVIVVQGKGIWPWVQGCECFEDVKPIDRELYKAKIGKVRSLLLSFTHPCARGAYNWGTNAHTPYLINTVKPAVKRARRYLLRSRHIC